METTWKPIVAGTINIVVGIFTLLGVFIMSAIIVGASGSILALSRIADLMPVWLSGFLQLFFIIGAFIFIILSGLPLIGGVYALQRKNWRWALTGSIVAIISSTILGIVSTILVSLSRNEFEKYDRFH